MFGQALVKRKGVKYDRVVERGDESGDRVGAESEVVSVLRERLHLSRKIQILDIVGGSGGDR